MPSKKRVKNTPVRTASKPPSTPKYLVVLSDLHVGSSVAIWPKDHQLRYGQTPGVSELQNWMYDCWQDGVEWMNDITHGSYVLGLNGDLIDGKHHRATELMSSLVDDQVEACIELLKPIANKAHSVYATLGTECHTGEAEHAIASALGAKKSKKWATAYNSITLDMQGVRTELMHHITTAQRPWTEASGHSIAMNMRRAETARLGRQSPHVMIRGHRHRPGYFCDGGALTVVTPSWQALTRWAWKVLPGAECVIGFTVIDYSQLEMNQIPHVRFKFYSPDEEPLVKP